MFNLSKYLVFFIFCSATAAYAQTDRDSKYAIFQTSGTHCGVSPTSKYTSFGSLKWKFKSNGKIFSSPAVINGMAYVGSEDHYLYAIAIKTGKQVWKFKTGGTVDSSPAVYENVIYFGSLTGIITL